MHGGGGWDLIAPQHVGISGGTSGKESAFSARVVRDVGLIPEEGHSPQDCKE